MQDMRIAAYNQIQPVYKNQKVNRGTQPAAAGSAKDQLQISSIGKDIQAAKAALAESPDVREELISSIKSRIEDGSYQVDNGSFAEKLIERYQAVI